MKVSCKQLFALIGAGALSALSASAESVSEQLKIDFEDYAIGSQLNSNGGGPQEFITVVEDPFGGAQGHVLHINKPEGWDSYARIPSITCPKGFTLADCIMIEVNYYNAAETPKPLGIRFRSEGAGWTDVWTEVLDYTETTSGAWGNTAVYSPDDLLYTESGEKNRKASSFSFAFGFFQDTSDYYIDDIVFYFEKEVSQREMDEAALDKSTAPCIEINFDNLEANAAGSPNVGSNGGGRNRADMIIDKGPAGYDNNCVHIIYGGWTQIFLYDLIKCPEGYTFDDLRLVEYDIYETDIAGVDCTTSAESPGKNGAPVLKVKAPQGWNSNSNGSPCGNTALPSVNEWHHVEFAPSAIAWEPSSYNVTEGEGDDAVITTIEQDAEQTAAEMNKQTSFSISVGFFPCLNQCYVDNVKLWFQKSKASSSPTGIEDIIVTPAEADGYSVYNLQGVLVMKTADKSEINNLPAGLYIINGKKYVVK